MNPVVEYYLLRIVLDAVFKLSAPDRSKPTDTEDLKLCVLGSLRLVAGECVCVRSLFTFLAMYVLPCILSMGQLWMLFILQQDVVAAPVVIVVVVVVYVNPEFCLGEIYEPPKRIYKWTVIQWQD